MTSLANNSLICPPRLSPPRKSASSVLRRLIGEGLWVVAGQVAYALGLLVSGRILTAFVPPEIYGAVALLLGVVSIGTSIFCSPHLQALMRFYPDFAAAGRIGFLRRTVGGVLRRWAAVLVGGVLVGGWAARSMMNVPYSAIAALAAFLWVDIFCLLENAFLSAARRQRVLALWRTLNGWLRPGMAVLVVICFGATSQAVLAGYALGSAGLWLVFSLTGMWEGIVEPEEPLADNRLRAALHRYALPLMPLAVVGWITSVSDRYLIGGLAGLQAAGLYAAAYSLSSHPFLMLSGIVELTLRPAYYDAVASGNRVLERKMFRLWLLTVLGLSALGVFLIFLLKESICYLLLAESYRRTAGLMPWIAAGCAFQAVASVLERTCYAYKRTGLVTASQLVGATASIVAEVPLIRHYGLQGAAFAVPIYFGVQMVSALCANRIVCRQNGV